MIKTGSTENMYYTCTNHLGTINALVSRTGTIAEEYSTDAWGRRRNPSDWSYTNITTPALINRSYAGHVREVVFWLQKTHRTTPQQCGEHLDAFGLINMNARLYDPVIGRMLSPDNYLQDAANGQNYNRYTYVLNNPLKFTDPTGNEIDGGPWQKSVPAANDNTAYWNAYSAVIDGIQEEIKRQSSERGGGGTIASLDEPEITFGYQTLQEVYIYADKGQKPFMKGKKLDVHDYNAWKNAQGGGGYPGINIYEGYGMSGGITTPPLGIFVEKGAGTDLKQHEYGHYLQYKNMGALSYYKNVALPSLYNAAENSFERAIFGKTVFSVPHSNYRTETDANRNALQFFGNSIDRDFNRYFPTNTQTTPFTWSERLGIYYMILCPTCPR